MKNKIIILICSVVALFTLVAVMIYLKNKAKENDALTNYPTIIEKDIGNQTNYSIIANSSVVSMKSGDTNVENFLKIAKQSGIEFKSTNVENCYNITPAFVTENTEYKIFKFEDTAECYILYNDEVYDIGNYNDGYGTLSFALADTNQDDVFELFYTYSWKSGVIRTNVGYFDPIEKKECKFNDLYFKGEEGILVERNGYLCIASAEFSEFIDVTNFKLNAGKTLAKIEVRNNGEVRLVEE